jgi:hypothetical protein
MPMNKYEWEDKIDASNVHSLEFPQQRDPREFPYGYFGSDDFVLASAGSFMWFESPHEMLTWLKLGEPKLYEVPDEDLQKIAGPIDDALPNYVAPGSSLDPELIAQIRKGSKGYFCIDWWGKFDELVSGETPFASDVRERFWDLYAEDEELERDVQPPIPPNLIDVFLIFLSEYGV